MVSFNTNINSNSNYIENPLKLVKKLLIDDSEANTQYKSITVAGKTFYDINKLDEDILVLVNCKNKLEKLKLIIPEFKHKI